MKDEFININGEPFRDNRFYKDSNQLTKLIEKVIDRYDKALEVLFSVLW